jgi:hypothetical protein
MMTWNYRLVHRIVNDEHIYAIHEAYYDDNKETSITEEPTHPQGETLEELKRDCEHYMQALGRPVLEYSDF